MIPGLCVKFAFFVVCRLQVLLDHRKHKTKKLLMESDRYNNTPLHIASEKGYINIVKVKAMESLHKCEKFSYSVTPHILGMFCKILVDSARWSPFTFGHCTVWHFEGLGMVPSQNALGAWG